MWYILMKLADYWRPALLGIGEPHEQEEEEVQ